MAKLTDKFFNRVIEGPFEPDSADEAKIIKGLEGQDIKVKKLESTSDAKVGGKLDITGNVNVGGNLDVTGDAKLFEKIVDKDGHKRFIEGNVRLATTAPEGFVKTYGKWALSGSHLLIVIAGTLANETVSTWQEIFAVAEDVPSWIRDKIYPMASTFIDIKPTSFYSTTLDTVQNVAAYLRKGDSNLYVSLAAVTANANRVFRIAFDVLIDNEAEA